MRKSLVIPLMFFFLFLGFYKTAYSTSEYVLPYPSSMPGSIFYKISLVKERLMKYWYFGDFAQFSYNLKQSDKYLVEAKTLFEYRQYLLAYNSLEKSNKYFKNLNPVLIKAKNNNKDIIQKQKILKDAAAKHIEVLNLIKNITPESFVWTPEKAESISLNLKKAIEEAIEIRKNNI